MANHELRYEILTARFSYSDVKKLLVLSLPSLAVFYHSTSTNDEPPLSIASWINVGNLQFGGVVSVHPSLPPQNAAKQCYQMKGSRMNLPFVDHVFMSTY